MDFIQHIDRVIFLFLNGLHCAFLDPVMTQISLRFIWVPFYAAIIFFIIRERKWNAIATLLLIALMIVLSDQISDLIKDSVQRLRPTHNPAIANLVHTVNGYTGGSFGFVSSHAANMFATAAFVSMFFSRRWLTIVMFCWAALVAYSRIYLGVHYPLDILCGGILGYAIGVMIFYVERLVYRKMTQKASSLS
jgi:undecaprenyl-diphosphatase